MITESLLCGSSRKKQSLEKRFFKVCNEFQKKGKIDPTSLAHKLRGTVEEWQVFNEIKGLEALIDEEKVFQLEEIIINYPEIQNERKTILNAFRLKKPLTSLELYRIFLHNMKNSSMIFTSYKFTVGTLY